MGARRLGGLDESNKATNNRLVIGVDATCGAMHSSFVAGAGASFFTSFSAAIA
jgi:hypothetical protein